MTVLSIQSQVARGHVGNSAAQFALQRVGITCWAVPTIILSRHKAHRGWRGWQPSSRELADVLAALESDHGFAALTGLLTSYLPTPAMIRCAARTVASARRQAPGLDYLLDPVFGDYPGGFYLPETCARAIASHLLPGADIATPNRFELAWLTDMPADDPGSAAAAAAGLAGRMRAPATAWVLCSSVPCGPDSIGTLLHCAGRAWLAETPILRVAGHGAGDLLAAMLLAHRLRGAPPPVALGAAVSAVFAVLEAAAGAHSGAIDLVASQAALLDPPRKFTARLLAAGGRRGT